MTVQNLVSVVIPVYNRFQWLDEALKSVLEQTHSSVELILCNDGSDEAAVAELKQLTGMDPERIRVLHMPHRGAGPAREAGRQAARGEFIQYLDSDDRLHPEKFERQIAALRACPECGIAYGRTRLIDEDGNVLQESYKKISQKDFIFPGLLVDRWWCTHTPLYRREVCDRIGPWSDLRYSQDWEYDSRAGALKTKLVFVDAVVSDHRDHGDPQRQTGKGRWLVTEDQLRFFQTLYECALEAGVKADSPEMKHFVRWVFAAAREAGREENTFIAGNLLGLARRACGGRSVEIIMYRSMVGLLGWRRATLGVEWLREKVKRKVGGETLQQSWMN